MRRWAVLMLLAPMLALAAPMPLATLQQRSAELVDIGYDRPDEAIASLQRMHAGVNAAAQRSLLFARGAIAARAGRSAVANELANDLRKSDDALARADSELVRALLAETEDRLDMAAEHAQAAAGAYAQWCGAAPAPRADCDYRLHWRALLVLATRARTQGNGVLARVHMQQAADIALGGEDVFRRAWAVSTVAAMSASLGEFDLARRQMQQAQRLAELEGGPLIAARVKINEARLARAQGNGAGALRALEDAVPLAERGRSPRLVAIVHGHLSDAYLMTQRPRDALRAIEQSLPVVRRFGEQRTERVLLHNAGLARIALGQLDAGRSDMEHLLELWDKSGAAGDQAIALREFSDALAAAGDVQGALELVQRERKLSAGIRAANRESTLRELQTRYDRETKERNIELLERDNAVKSAQLANRTLTQRIWILVAAMLALAVLLATLLYRRMRETQRRLEHSHALLRVQTERDPLTGLANRRHFQDVMRSRGAHEAFDGALLLVDVDHFKRINDERGHAAGDQVLVEVARRLGDAVRGDDLVVRWGGEEFLVFAPGVAADQVDALASRVLRAVGDVPVALETGPLRVTASIGYGRFPLPPHRVTLTWEQAVNLADMAMYTAKSQGRNRAVGITSSQAPHRDALAQVEADFERACTQGKVTCKVVSEGAL